MFDQQSVGSGPDTCVLKENINPDCFVKVGEAVLSALPARIRTDDTQAHIRMDCERGNPVSALGVGGNSFWKKNKTVAHSLK